VRIYALVELGDPETIDLFFTEEEAERALKDCLRDEPELCGVLVLSKSSSRRQPP
jgi:hypothetical protein